MKFHTDPSDDGVGIQMAPMVDVVFQLLAFFVMGTQFGMLERDFAMGYSPPAALAQGAKAGDFPSQIPVVLQKGPRGVVISLGATPLEANDFKGLSARLAQINMPAIEVRILADPELSVDDVAKAMDAVLASPMKKLSVGGLARAAPGASGT